MTPSVENTSFFKRRSQTYHYHFMKSFKADTEKKSRKSRKSKRLSNPFIPMDSRLMSSSSSEDSQNIDFHLVDELGEGKLYASKKAVNLKTGKPLVAKYFKVIITFLDLIPS